MLIRLVTQVKGTATSAIFLNSKEGTIYRQVYENVMHPEYPFMSIKEGLQKVSEEYHIAYFEDKVYVYGQTQDSCGVSFYL